MKLNDDKKKELKRFGITVGIAVCIIIGIFLPWWIEYGFSIIPFVIGSILILCGVIKPLILYPIHIVWMKIALWLGYVNTRIILFLVYYIVVTPIAIVRRLLLNLDGSNSTPKTYKIYVENNDSVNDFERPY